MEINFFKAPVSTSFCATEDKRGIMAPWSQALPTNFTYIQGCSSQFKDPWFICYSFLHAKNNAGSGIRTQNFTSQSKNDEQSIGVDQNMV